MAIATVGTTARQKAAAGRTFSQPAAGEGISENYEARLYQLFVGCQEGRPLVGWR